MLFGLTGIIEQVFGGGSLKEQALKIAKKRLAGQLSRSAGKQLGRACHKAIAAVMGTGMPGTLDQRIEVGTQLAETLAVQAEQLAGSLRAFAVAQAELERNRTGAGTANALAAREAAEFDVEEDCIDLGRVLNGDDASEEEDA